MATTTPKTPAKTNYLNNRDILKQIHLSKNTYCSYLDPVNDHQYDIILPTVEKINQRTIAEARRNKADRLKREGIIVDPKKIAIDNSTDTARFASKVSRRDGLLSFSTARMI